MPIVPNKFVALCNRLNKIDLFGDGPPLPPWGDRAPANPATFTHAVQSSSSALPLDYESAYVQPLLQHLSHVFRVAGDPTTLETLAGAVYDHSAGADITQPLQRFLAVVSNFYRSFLSKARRAQANFPIVEQLPPLVTFNRSGKDGPFTMPCDQVKSICQANVGVVSLPSTYRDHPVLWTSLAHQTGGHDVTHADANLLPELEQGVMGMLAGDPVRGISAVGRPDPAFLGLLWAYWMDEAAADVYGILNVGPTFAINLAAFFAALNNQGDPANAPVPTLRSFAGADPQNGNAMDVHPVDLLRLHLAMGVIDNLPNLSAAARNGYLADIQTLAQLCGQGVDSVTLQGFVGLRTDQQIFVNQSLPLADMQDAARKVGAFVATATLNSLGGHSIQDLETWDDTDEARSQAIATALRADQTVVAMGDDAQLLAGANLVLADDPTRYDVVTARLNEALDESFATDPIWGKPAADHAYIRTRILRPDSPELRKLFPAEGGVPGGSGAEPVPGAKSHVRNRGPRKKGPS